MAPVALAFRRSGQRRLAVPIIVSRRVYRDLKRGFGFGWLMGDIGEPTTHRACIRHDGHVIYSLAAVNAIEPDTKCSIRRSCLYTLKRLLHITPIITSKLSYLGQPLKFSGDLEHILPGGLLRVTGFRESSAIPSMLCQRDVNQRQRINGGEHHCGKSLSLKISRLNIQYRNALSRGIMPTDDRDLLASR